MMHYTLIFVCLVLSACSGNPKTKCGVDKRTFEIAKNESKSIKGMKEKDVREKFGEPSFIIDNENDQQCGIQSSNWYYVYYEIARNDISKNHDVSNVKILIIRFVDCTVVSYEEK